MHIASVPPARSPCPSGSIHTCSLDLPLSSVNTALDTELHFASRQMEALKKRMARLVNERAAKSKCDLAAFRAKLPEKLKVLIVTPCDDGHKLCYWNSIRALEKAKDPAGHTYEVLTPPGDSLIPRARNNFSHTFQFKTNFDYIGWIDSDEDFRPEDIWRLISHRLPIVAGTYYIKDREGRPCINTIPGEAADENGLLRVATAGTGALFYHRSVIDAMIEAADWWPHWPIRYVCDNTKDVKYHLFHHGVVDDPDFGHTPRDLSEDWSWCYFARKLGYDVYLDTKAVFIHRGEIDYPLHARRMSADEVARGEVVNPDANFKPAPKPEPV